VARLESRHKGFVIEGRGVRCVSDRPWVTVAETCEYALAQLAAGHREVAEDLFRWAQQYRTDDGRYWTGTVFPDESRFPAGERSTYTASAVVLAADGLSGASPASDLFTRHDEVLPVGFEADADEPVNERE
jgi:MMP endo-(1,4)-3-O-methyl-alpha-D-mannosidase